MHHCFKLKDEVIIAFIFKTFRVTPKNCRYDIHQRPVSIASPFINEF